MTAPPPDLSPAARAARHREQLLARRDARRTIWRESAGNRGEYRRLMAARLDSRTRP